VVRDYKSGEYVENFSDLVAGRVYVVENLEWSPFLGYAKAEADQQAHDTLESIRKARNLEHATIVYDEQHCLRRVSGSMCSVVA